MFESYRQGRKLGEGTFGKVYEHVCIKAHDISPVLAHWSFSEARLTILKNHQRACTQIDDTTGHRVAIKRIRLGRAKDGLPSCAYAELRALQELRHPNVVEVRHGSWLFHPSTRHQHRRLLGCLAAVRSRQLCGHLAKWFHFVVLFIRSSWAYSHEKGE